MSEMGYFVGRMNPIHIGHERVIDHMIETYGPDNSTIVIGSNNNPTSIRHFFSYGERENFVKTLYPDVNVIGIPDFTEDDTQWLKSLDDLIAYKYGREHLADAHFFGGSNEDVGFFLAAGRQVKILNRFDGTGPKVSASEVRDCLIEHRSTEGMLNAKVAADIAAVFHRKWQVFKQT